MNKTASQILFGFLTLLGLGGAGLAIKGSFNNNNFTINSNRSNQTPPQIKHTASTNHYSCERNGPDFVLMGRIEDNERPVMGFNSTIWGKDYPKPVRCQMVKQSLIKYDAHFITTGEKNGYSILCASKGPGYGCLKDESGGQIVTLGRTGVSSQKYLNTLLVSLNPDPQVLQASPGFIQTGSRVYIDLDKMIKEGNNYTTYITEKK
jgi:hypothetical protein